jgi:SAM-dependent methyltransferase
MNAHDDLAPSPWIARFAALVPAGARVLDLAAGRGRHARFLAGRGAQVLAVDRDAGALAALAGVEGVTTRVQDLESGAWPLAGERFDAIVVVNYLHRPQFPHLRAALAADGVLLYETFAMGNEAYGRPSNPDHLLCPGELLSLAALAPSPLTVVAFEQGLTTRGARPAVVQRIAAVGSPWPPVLEREGARATGGR